MDLRIYDWIDITVPADALAPHNTDADYISFLWPDDVIQNGRRDVEKSRGTSSVKIFFQCSP